MPDGREREQVRGSGLLLWPLNLPEWEAENGVIVVSLHSAAALFACIPAGREGNCALHSSFVPSAISFFGARAGIGGFGGSLPLAAALLVCKPVEMKASAEHVRIFALPSFNSHGLDRWRGIHVNVSLTSGGRARGTLIPFAFLSFNLHGLGRGEGKGVGDSYS